MKIIPSVNPPCNSDSLDTNDGGIASIFGGGHAIDLDDVTDLSSSDNGLENDKEILNDSLVGKDEPIATQSLPATAYCSWSF
jgi:hypothetical protein